MKNLLIKFSLGFILLIGFNVSRAQDSLQISDSVIGSEFNDTLPDNSEIDSLNSAYSLIFHHLRLQNEELQMVLFRRARIISFLAVLLALAILIIIRVSSRKMLHSSFPYSRQKKGEQPGYLCLKMMYQYYYGRKITYKKIAGLLGREKNEPVSIEDIALIAEQLDFEVKIAKVSLSDLIKDQLLPLMLFMPNHMVVLFKIKNDNFYLSDPFYGQISVKSYYFATSWLVDQNKLEGIIISLYPVKPVKRSLRSKINLDKFRKINQLDKKTWKNYTCDVEVG